MTDDWNRVNLSHKGRIKEEREGQCWGTGSRSYMSVISISDKSSDGNSEADGN